MRINEWIKKVISLVAPLAVLVVLVSGQAFAAEENQEKVNVNTATVEQLSKLPGVTPEIAGAIVKYREEVGDYQAVDELLQVKGMPKELYEKIKDVLTIDGVGGSKCTC